MTFDVRRSIELAFCEALLQAVKRFDDNNAISADKHDTESCTCPLCEQVEGARKFIRDSTEGASKALPVRFEVDAANAQLLGGRFLYGTEDERYNEHMACELAKEMSKEKIHFTRARVVRVTREVIRIYAHGVVVSEE
ncbi:MAG TPA: hypothetical protein VGK73_03900 [Polyangiaceae bacterium]